MTISSFDELLQDAIGTGRLGGFIPFDSRDETVRFT
jgi:hypothetical protein